MVGKLAPAAQPAPPASRDSSTMPPLPARVGASMRYRPRRPSRMRLHASIPGSAPCQARTELSTHGDLLHSSTPYIAHSLVLARIRARTTHAAAASLAWRHALPASVRSRLQHSNRCIPTSRHINKAITTTATTATATMKASTAPSAAAPKAATTTTASSRRYGKRARLYSTHARMHASLRIYTYACAHSSTHGM